MTSIRKTKKALKRKIRRIDAAIIELAKHEGTGRTMWDLFLWRNYFGRKIKHLRKVSELGEMPTFVRCVSPERILNQIKFSKEDD